ncbi:helix-turn-helix transcriptional regulator [Cytobacillus firmus]|uniref:Uncharacterized protein n=1 Tax=Cytobacillus firmus DS1 TaxID=1307436 RepID=W7KLZ1_CYTFI|nr:helix-turn-helix transcriptional regulator [Cytobacillus firmus]EWG08415.1 hypothetical protein PBF_24278 [Cytobacillus firmus DS1]
MEEKQRQPVSIEIIGLSQRELNTLFILKTLMEGTNYPKALYKELTERFNGKRHSYAYFCKVAKELAESGHLLLEKEGSFNVYNITKKGESLYQWYQLNFKERLYEVKMVIDRFVYDLTRSGNNPPVEHELPDEHRNYFAKLVSVMDLVRYVTLKAAMNQGHIHMAGIEEILMQRYGWVTSSGYHYKLARDMEKNGLLVGKWEGVTRTKRLLRITEEGKHHYKQIADSAAERVQAVQHYLISVLKFL